MSRRNLAPALMLALCLAGGAALPGCVAGSAGPLPVQGAAAEAPSVEATDAPEGYGFVRLAIRWPLAYRTQVLPTSSKRISIQLKDSADSNVGAPVAVVFPTVSATLGPIAKGTNAYKVAVTVQPDEAVSNTVIASKTTSLFSVYSGATVAVTLNVDPAFAPTITSGNEPSAGTLQIFGTNFQPDHVAPAKPTVTFTTATGVVDAPANDVTVLGGGTRIDVLIPPAAIDGNVTVTVDGLSASMAMNLQPY